MKIIHIADLHASRVRIKETLYILEKTLERVKQGDIDYVIFSGDFFDGVMTNTKASGLSDIIRHVRKISDVCRIKMIYGTPKHEPDGCLEIFMDDNCDVYSGFSTCIEDCKGNKVQFIFMPEPRKSDYIRESIDETNKAIKSSITEFIDCVSSNNDIRDYRIVIYHGEIKGCVYPNGEQASSPIAVTKEQLMSMKADYYACGHIHLPVEVFDKCWYAAPPYPCNFGELHEGCYNLVTIDNGNTSVERISLGLPSNIVVEHSIQELEKGKFDFANKNVKCIVKCTKEEAKKIDKFGLEKDIKDKSHAVSVKIDLQVEQVTNIRSKEISSIKTSYEKLLEYSRVNEIKIPDGVKEKLEDIESHMLIKYVFPIHSFRFMKLYLKGAIGIKDGTGKDEITFDVSDSNGLIVLVGDNGHGKTTLIENCHPFPQMLTRTTIPFRENFFLKDSCRIVYYQDENGLYYKLSILIDAHIKNGKIDYFAETSKDFVKWERVAGVDGSLASYQEYITNTFGTIDVFLRTSFMAKDETKGIPDITTATKSERMNLFSKLAGTEYLNDISDTAHEEWKELSDTLNQKKSEYKTSDSLTKQIDYNLMMIASKKRDGKELESDIETVNKEVIELEKQDKEYQKKAAENSGKEELLKQYTQRYSFLEDENIKANNIIKKWSDYISNKDEIDEYSKNKNLISDADKQITEQSASLSEMFGEIQNIKESLYNLQDKYNVSEINKTRLESAVKEELSKCVDIDDTCPTCGAKLSEEKHKELESIVNKYKDNASSIQKEIDSIKSEEDNLSKSISDKKEELSVIQSGYDVIKESISSLKNDKKEYETKLESLSEYSKYFDSEPVTEYDYNKAKETVINNESEISDISSKIKSLSDDIILKDVSSILKDKKNCLADKTKEYHELTSAVEVFEQENIRLQQEIDKQSDVLSDIKSLEKECSILDFIYVSFGNKGIQALELESSAPEVADIANRILYESYGDRFTISFKTQKKSKSKIIEDFSIMAYDSAKGRDKQIDIVSTGERIWLKQALYYAFGAVRMNRTGFNFATRFIDEADGSLSIENRYKYYDMIKSAHKQSGAELTILITQSQEIKDIAENIIEM